MANVTVFITLSPFCSAEKKLSVCVRLGVNHYGTNHNRYTYHLYTTDLYRYSPDTVPPIYPIVSCSHG